MITIVILIHVGTATNCHFEAGANSTTANRAAALCNHILLQTGRVDGSFD
jgi:hypothetical protein